VLTQGGLYVKSNGTDAGPVARVRIWPDPRTGGRSSTLSKIDLNGGHETQYTVHPLTSKGSITTASINRYLVRWLDGKEVL
jgi:hypothetical protein